MPILMSIIPNYIIEYIIQTISLYMMYILIGLSLNLLDFDIN